MSCHGTPTFKKVPTWLIWNHFIGTLFPKEGHKCIFGYPLRPSRQRPPGEKGEFLSEFEVPDFGVWLVHRTSECERKTFLGTPSWAPRLSSPPWSENECACSGQRARGSASPRASEDPNAGGLLLCRAGLCSPCERRSRSANEVILTERESRRMSAGSLPREREFCSPL